MASKTADDFMTTTLDDPLGHRELEYIHHQYLDDYYSSAKPKHDRICNKQRSLMAEIRVLEDIIKRDLQLTTGQHKEKLKQAVKSLKKKEITPKERGKVEKLQHEFKERIIRIEELKDLIDKKRRALQQTTHRLENLEHTIQTLHEDLDAVEDILSETSEHQHDIEDNLYFVPNELGAALFEEDDIVFSIMPDEFMDNEWDFAPIQTIENFVSTKQETPKKYRMSRQAQHDIQVNDLVEEFGFSDPKAVTEFAVNHYKQRMDIFKKI